MFINQLKNHSLINSTITRSLNEDQNLEAILDEFRNNHIYIFIGIFDLNTTLKLYCQIYKKKMYGENYQWIILGSSLNNLKKFYLNGNHSNCSFNEILLSMNGTLQTKIVQYSFDYYKKSKNFNKNAELNKSETVLKSITDSYMNNYFKDCSPNNTICFQSSCFHGYTFDLFLTIFNLIGSLIENNQFSCNHLAFERDQNWFKIVNEALNNLSFTGVTVIYIFAYSNVQFLYVTLFFNFFKGQVRFVNGRRIGEIKLEQIKSN
jgi:hypothetical protein